MAITAPPNCAVRNRDENRAQNTWRTPESGVSLSQFYWRTRTIHQNAGVSRRKLARARDEGVDRLLPLRRPNGRPGVGGRRQARGGRLRLASWRKQFAPVGPRPHLVARCSGDEIAIFPYLPSSAKGAVDGNCPQGHVARRDGQIALRLEQILFCRQNGCEVAVAPLSYCSNAILRAPRAATTL